MNTQDKPNHKILRLSTGEDIIGYCMLDDDSEIVLISNPMKVLLQRVAEAKQTVMIMMPWLPLELIEEDIATINYSDIITMVTPKASFIEYYDNMVDKYQSIVENRDEELFEDEDGFDEDSSEDTVDSIMDEVLNFKQQKNQLLH